MSQQLCPGAGRGPAASKAGTGHARNAPLGLDELPSSALALAVLGETDTGSAQRHDALRTRGTT